MSPDTSEFQTSSSIVNASPTQERETSSQQATQRILTFEAHGHVKPEPHIKIYETGIEKYLVIFRLVKKPNVELSLTRQYGALGGISYLHAFSQTYNIGLGIEADSVEWVDCKLKGLKGKRTFSWQGDTYELDRIFEGDDGQPLQNSRTRYYFSIIDCAGNRLASYSPCQEEGRKMAQLKLADIVSEELERVIILVICSWLEVARRASLAPCQV